jgi:hypothetical protein
MKRHAWLVVVPALAVALRLLHGPGHIGYDAIWALLWGRQLARGEIPDFEAPIAPTPHPLANLVSAPLSLLGYDAAITAVLALSWEFPSERPKGDRWTALAYADDRTAAVFRVSRAAPPAGAAGLPPGRRRIAANEHLLLYARC